MVICKDEYDGNRDIINKIGKVIPDNNERCLNNYVMIEFFEYVDGHDGDGSGKYGNCWNFPENTYVLKKIKVNNKEV